jgi:hypothetical protein
VHLGRLLRTVFLCDYFLNEVFRRELLRVLNRGEAVNAGVGVRLLPKLAVSALHCINFALFSGPDRSSGVPWAA